MSRLGEIDPAEAGRQLLLVGPSSYDPVRLAEQLDAALAVGGIAGFVLRVARAGGMTAGLVADLGALRTLCAKHSTAFIVGDDLDLALEMDADGVHLGGGTGDVQAARAALGEQRILGVSCGVSRDAAMVAGERGADYVAFGDLGRRPGRELYDLLRWWSELFVLPCLAEAIATDDDCTRLAKAGADLVAAGEAVWTDPEGVAHALGRLREALQAA